MTIAFMSEARIVFAAPTAADRPIIGAHTGGDAHHHPGDSAAPAPEREQAAA